MTAKRSTKRTRRRKAIQHGGMTPDEMQSWRLRIRLLLARAVVRSAYSGANLVGVGDPVQFMSALMMQGAKDAAKDAKLAAEIGMSMVSGLFTGGTMIAVETWTRMTHMLGGLGGLGSMATEQLIANMPALLGGAENTAGMAVLGLVLFAWVSGASGNDIVEIVEDGIRKGGQKSTSAAGRASVFRSSMAAAIGRITRGSAEIGDAVRRFTGIIVRSIASDVCGPAIGAPKALVLSTAPHISAGQTAMSRIEESMISIIERVARTGEGASVVVQMVTAMVQVMSMGDLGSLYRASERAFRFISNSISSGAAEIMRSIERCRADTRGAAAAAASSCSRTPALLVEYLRGSWQAFLGRIRRGRTELDLESIYRQESREARAREDELQARNRAYFDMVLARMTEDEREMTEALHRMVEEFGVMEGTIYLIGRTNPEKQAELERLLDSQLGDPSEERATIRGPEAPRCIAPGPEDATPASASASQEMFSPPALLSSMDPADLGQDAMDAFENARTAEEIIENQADIDFQVAREHAAEIRREADDAADAALTLAGLRDENRVPQAAPPPLPQPVPQISLNRTLKRSAPGDDDEEERELKRRKEQEGGKQPRRTRKRKYSRRSNPERKKRKSARTRRRKTRR